MTSKEVGRASADDTHFERGSIGEGARSLRNHAATPWEGSVNAYAGGEGGSWSVRLFFRWISNS